MTTDEIKVWDPFVRIFHWTVVVSFFVAYVTEDDVMWLHEIAGYIILGLVIARVFWGLVGSHYARFTNFIYKPATVKKYLSDSLHFKAKRYLGHNPLAGGMVVLLLIMLALTSWSGIEAQDISPSGDSSVTIEIVKSALANDEHKSNGNEFWEEIHEFFANATLLLVFLHVAGVIFSSITHGENLIRAMVTGRKRKED